MQGLVVRLGRRRREAAHRCRDFHRGKLARLVPLWLYAAVGAALVFVTGYAGISGAWQSGGDELLIEGADPEPRAVAPLAGLPGVADVRTAGLAAGIELDAEMLSAHPTAGAQIVLAARRHGVLTRLLRGAALQISPPFVVTEAEIGEIAGAVEAALREVVPAL